MEKFWFLFSAFIVFHTHIQAEIIIPPEGDINLHRRLQRSPPWTTSTSSRGALSSCLVGISEIYVTDEQYFLEFGRECKQPKLGRKLVKPLRFYKLLILTDTPLRLGLVADLGSEHMLFRDEEDHFVFGFTATNSFASNARSLGVQASSSAGGIVFKSKIPYIALLFYSDNLDLSRKIRLFKNPSHGYENRPLKDDAAMLGQIISENTVDLVVFCKEGPCEPLSNELKAFLSLIEQKQDSTVGKSSVPLSGTSSLNNCDGFSRKFNYIHFRYGRATPGVKNDCSGAPPIVCEHIISGSAQPLAQNFPTSFGVRREDYDSIFQCEKSSPFVKKPLKDIAIKSRTVTYSRPQQKHAISQWPILRSKEGDIQSCRDIFPNGGWILDRPYIRSWLYVSKSENKCTLKCTYCQKFFSLGFRPDYWWKRPIATEAGYVAKLARSDNMDAVLEHEKEPTHHLAKLFADDISNPQLVNEEDAIDRYELAEYLFFEPTVRVVALVYAEILTTSSFNSHRTFIAAMKSLNIDFGVHHFHERASADITGVISETFHKTLLKSLVTGDHAFSLIVDGSTDNRNNHLFVCLIQTLEDNHPVVYFYALLHLQIGESAKLIFETFQKRLEEDELIQPGFVAFFRKNLQAVVSDSASVMVGKSNSFYTHLKNYISRNIISIGCMAHKLELSVQRALIPSVNPDFVYFKQFEKKANMFYQFYMSRGSKRFIHLQETGLDLHETTRRLKKFYEIRWMSSHHGVILALTQDFKILAKDLHEMKEDSDLSKSTRDGASDLFDIVTDKSFALVLHEFLDFLKIFKKTSLTLQSSPGVLLRKHEIMQTAVTELDALSGEPGNELQAFLNNCVCPKKCVAGSCSLKQVESCKAPVCHGVTLKDHEKSPMKLLKCRKEMYKSFVNEIRKYFDLNQLSSLDIFDLDKYKTGVSNSWNLHSLPDIDSKFETVCKFFSLNILDCQQFTVEYKNLLTNTFIPSSSSQSITQEFNQPLDMLIYFLNQQEIPLSTVLRTVISTVIIIPYGSADCERAFSMVTRIKSKERSNILPTVVEQLTRIKMNGPKDMADFDAFYYARIFLRRHYRADARTGGRPASSIAGDNRRSHLF